MMNKKGDSSGLGLIGKMVVIIVIILILLFAIVKDFRNFVLGIDSCEAKKGACFTSCGTRQELWHGNGACEKEKMVCCELGPEELLEGTRGEGANRNIMKVLINKNNVKYSDSIDVEIGTDYKIETILDYDAIKKISGVKESTKRKCSIIIQDMSLDVKEGMALPNALPQTVLKLNSPDMALKWDSDWKSFPMPVQDESMNSVDSLVIDCSKESSYTNKLLNPRYFRPRSLDAGRRYTVEIIVYDDEVTNAASKNNAEGIVELNKLVYNQNHWLAHFYFSLNVKPIAEITDISTSWVAYDDIYVKSYDPYKLSNVLLAIVNQEEVDKSDGSNIYAKIYNKCIDKDISGRYTSSINKTTALKAGKEGFNLLFMPIGRKNYQTALYESQVQPIVILEDSTKIRLDASSIAANFNKDSSGKNIAGDLLTEETDSKNVQNHYICAKVDVVNKAGVKKTVTIFSTSPLKLDVAPPLIENTDDYIKVVYPKPMKSQIEELIGKGFLKQGQQVTPYYFQEYPKIVIQKCTDKSGCASYDYAFVSTNIKINVNTMNITEGIAGLLIGEGLNLLYKELLESNPLNNLCPLATSGLYRRNTFPEIRFTNDKQGVFCIKVTDSVGNYWLTWKSVYNPYDILDKVEEALTSGTPSDTRITPVIGS